MGISSGVVVALGVGIVFLGLIAIVFICYVMGFVCNLFAKPDAVKPVAQTSGAVSNAPIANKQEIIAGVCAVIAEELGTDVSNIRVTSFKKI